MRIRPTTYVPDSYRDYSCTVDGCPSNGDGRLVETVPATSKHCSGAAACPEHDTAVGREFAIRGAGL